MRGMFAQFLELCRASRVRKTGIRQKSKSPGGSNMRKRFYLFLSLIAALGLSVVPTSAFADQKDKAKEKSQNQHTQTKAASETPQVFALPGLGSTSSYLGVYLEEVTPDRMKELGLTEERGAIVTKVVDGSPAEK